MTLGDHQQPPVGVRNVLAAAPPKPQTPAPGLGRVRLPNPGSLNFPLRAALPARALTAPAWKSKRWSLGKGQSFQSQGQTSHCVRYGCTHLLMLTPIVRPNPWALTTGLYSWAQNNDPWPGAEPTYYGTSVDAGLRYLKNIAKVISEYRWARNMDEFLGRLCISARDGGGPLVGGSDWYEGMSSPKEGHGRMIVHPTGELWGGHCYDAIAHAAPTAKRSRLIGFANSHAGNFVFWMEDTEVEWLFFAQGGELAAVTELPR